MSPQSRARSFFGVASAIALLAPISLISCQSNAEKIAAFCGDWKGIVIEHKDSCDEMGSELEGLIESYEGVKLYGTAEDQASQEAVLICREAATEMLVHCANNEAVKRAIERLEKP